MCLWGLEGAKREGFGMDRKQEKEGSGEVAMGTEGRWGKGPGQRVCSPPPK